MRVSKQPDCSLELVFRARRVLGTFEKQAPAESVRGQSASSCWKTWWTLLLFWYNESGTTLQRRFIRLLIEHMLIIPQPEGSELLQKHRVLLMENGRLLQAVELAARQERWRNDPHLTDDVTVDRVMPVAA